MAYLKKRLFICARDRWIDLTDIAPEMVFIGFLVSGNPEYYRDDDVIMDVLDLSVDLHYATVGIVTSNENSLN